jgi:hypothetical protein
MLDAVIVVLELGIWDWEFGDKKGKTVKSSPNHKPRTIIHKPFISSMVLVFSHFWTTLQIRKLF